MTKSRLVWSSESGRICPDCGKPVSSCTCKKKEGKADKTARKYPDDGIIRIMRETKGRGGKTVTVIGNISMENNQLKEFVKRLKTRCGTGGTVKDGEIVIQGDHRQAIMEEITGLGFKARFSGG